MVEELGEEVADVAADVADASAMGLPALPTLSGSISHRPFSFFAISLPLRILSRTVRSAIPSCRAAAETVIHSCTSSPDSFCHTEVRDRDPLSKHDQAAGIISEMAHTAQEEKEGVVAWH